MDNNEDKKPTSLNFLALDPYMETNIVAPTETKVGSKEYILWGDKNAYPEYLAELFANCVTLHSVILGATDYVAGNGATLGVALQENGTVNRKGMTPQQLVKALARNYFIYGGFPIQVIRDKGGNVRELYPINMRFLRSDKENEVFWYSEKWKTSGSVKTVRYPKFLPTSEEDSSIYFFKGDVDTTYPQPIWAAAVKDSEVERSIDDFHLNNINNGFMGSYIVNFNNGVPTDEVKKEIEKMFNQKFAGKDNAGRIMFSWNQSKEAATTLQKMEIADYGEKYETLSKHSERAIYKAFRANPNLFGLATESNGFNSEEYESAFKLFNRTVIKPVQDSICDALDRILGKANVLTIVPFTLDGNNTNVQ